MEKLIRIKTVLEKGGRFSGINRKVQLKPLKWAHAIPASGDGAPAAPTVTEALLVLKWGGELTATGCQQAEALGRDFRMQMYSDDKRDIGLLRLHSTFRHDLKIYSSDEGRVQMTAAAFAKGLLELEGQLPPILVSLVRKDREAIELLDGMDSVRARLNQVKARLHEMMNRDVDIDDEARRARRPTHGAVRAC